MGRARLRCPLGSSPGRTFRARPFHVRSGDEDRRLRVSSATVGLNGVTLLGPSDCLRPSRGTSSVPLLTSDNTLEVTLASAPGSQLTIWMDGQPLVRQLVVSVDRSKTASATIDRVSGGQVDLNGGGRDTLHPRRPRKGVRGPDTVQVALTPITGIMGIHRALGSLQVSSSSRTAWTGCGHRRSACGCPRARGGATARVLVSRDRHRVSLIPISIDEPNGVVTFSVPTSPG